MRSDSPAMMCPRGGCACARATVGRTTEALRAAPLPTRNSRRFMWGSPPGILATTAEGVKGEVARGCRDLGGLAVGGYPALREHVRRNRAVVECVPVAHHLVDVEEQGRLRDFAEKAAKHPPHQAG